MPVALGKATAVPPLASFTRLNALLLFSGGNMVLELEEELEVDEDEF